MDQETITTEAPGIDSGADTNAGILTEADLASSFLERVEEQPEEKPTETEATDDSVAEAEEDSEGNVLSQSEQSEETETAEQETSSRDRSSASAGARAKVQRCRVAKVLAKGMVEECLFPSFTLTKS
jgi:hypothetical protein